MDEIKSKVLHLINRQHKQVKIPSMGFSDYFVQNLNAQESINKQKEEDNTDSESKKLSDSEVLESIEKIYYDEDCNINFYILEKISQNKITCDEVQKTMIELKHQHGVISKKVLQHILEKRNSCNEEFQRIAAAERELEETLWTCKKARSYLNYAKKQLSTTSLEILAHYRKREILKELLKSLNTIKVLKSVDTEMQKLLADGNYSGAISLLLECKSIGSEFTEYSCIQSLNQKLQETLILIEHQIDVALNEIIQKFDIKEYGKIQEAYMLLNKSVIAMDQLHINFISAIHSTVNNILKAYQQNSDEKSKELYEQLCQGVSIDRYIICLINLCKSIWTILSSYYQIIIWHQNYKLYQNNKENEWQDNYILEKLKKGQSRIWNDIQSKFSIYLSSTKLKTLKYEQFIQVLLIIQRLKRVGLEFCGENSNKLIETMRLQSEEFFNRYHISCLEEICLFLDNESWAPVDSFTDILQLQEFRSVKHLLQRQKSPPLEVKVPICSNDSDIQIMNNCDDMVSIHSQEGSSMYGSCGYFLRFSEKSSPFDGGLDAAMFEEDVLSGLVDEASCYFSEDTDEDDGNGRREEDTSCKFEEFSENQSQQTNQIISNNTSLNVLRCIGKYLQMCKLLHCISPQIVSSMLELIAFYIYAVHEIFGKDCVVQTESLYDEKLNEKLEVVSKNIIPKIKGWPLNFSSLINNELSNPDTLYGLTQRIVGVESGICMMKQFEQLKRYFSHLLSTSERKLLQNIQEHYNFAISISRPIYMCVTSKVIDLQGILMAMSKVKWDISHVSVQYSRYIDTMSRSIQSFAMRLEEISKEIQIPSEILWNTLSHVSTHLLVEGFSNVKKCSAGGRALMQLDFTHFMSILELISGLKFNQHRIYVESYIKAYYYPIDLFEEWIKTQKDKKEYSTKQLINLINCVCANDKRTRQKLLDIMENYAAETN